MPHSKLTKFEKFVLVFEMVKFRFVIVEMIIAFKTSYSILGFAALWACS